MTLGEITKQIEENGRTGMAGAKILDAEQKDIGIYKSIGCSVRMLRLSFAVRFGLVSAVVTVFGTLAAVCPTDRIVSSVMRHPDFATFLFAFS